MNGMALMVSGLEVGATQKVVFFLLGVAMFACAWLSFKPTRVGSDERGQ